jgi:hypothetical protein
MIWRILEGIAREREVSQAGIPATETPEVLLSTMLRQRAAELGSLIADGDIRSFFSEHIEALASADDYLRRAARRHYAVASSLIEMQRDGRDFLVRFKDAQPGELRVYIGRLLLREKEGHEDYIGECEAKLSGTFHDDDSYDKTMAQYNELDGILSRFTGSEEDKTILERERDKYFYPYESTERGKTEKSLSSYKDQKSKIEEMLNNLSAAIGSPRA